MKKQTNGTLTMLYWLFLLIGSASVQAQQTTELYSSTDDQLYMLEERSFLSSLQTPLLSTEPIFHSTTPSLQLANLTVPRKEEALPFLNAAPRFHQKRFWSAAGIGVAMYTGAMLALDQMWYSDYPRSDFHTFNDWNEWENMDKIGHAFSAYNETLVFFHGARWTGMNRKQALWTSLGVGTLIQTSIEVLDGFSDKWGFSLYDVGFNTLGSALFASQELLWQEQRITMKVSSYRKPYSSTPMYAPDGQGSSSVREHANEMFGTSLPNIFLKDYNAQTIWLSTNIHSFMKHKESNIPTWLNVAVGYGVQNVFGGYYNVWSKNGASYSLDANQYPRYRQLYLSLDIDLTRIKTRSRFLKTLFSALNMIKIPAPAIEFNSMGKIQLHPIHF